MLNLTILSLASSTLFLHSPAFVGNQIEFNKGYLNRFTSLVFYNQQNLLLTKTIFDRALNGIVLNDVNDLFQHDIIQKEDYTDNKVLKIESNPKRSVSIIECTFSDVIADYAIQIDSNNVSLYITRCLFSGCKSKQNGVINIGKCRCLTISHVCCSDVFSETTAIFLNAYCERNDFSVILYNSIVNSKCGSGNGYVFFPHYGNQHYRCNNVTDSRYGGFQFDAVQCFSFAMNTIVNCIDCFQFSGDIETEKSIENCNLICKRYLFILAGKNETSLKVYNSAFYCLNNDISEKAGINRHPGNLLSISFFDCMISDTVEDTSASYEGCIKTNKDAITTLIIPHFTYENVCLGKEHQTENAAYGCNAGHCIDDNCNSTIGFPDDVVPYTTMIYGDLQSKTFLPTKKFTPSNVFSNTNKFSESNKFTKSSDFLSTMMFSKSSGFTESDKFTKTGYFSQTDHFSDSSLFSISSHFTKSHVFSDSKTIKIFTDSSVFSMSITLLKNDGGDKSEDDNKGPNPAVIGAIVGVVAAAIIAAILAFIFIKKRRRINMTSDPNLIETNDSSLTIQNDLESIMNEDDPFAEEFK